MICPACATGDHDRCDNAGKDYAGCCCQHQTTEPSTEQESDHA